MIKFKTDNFLGKTVKSARIFCSIGVDKITDMSQILFAAGGDKFSRLCGFIFDSSNENTDYPRFSIAYVSKFRSGKYRRNPTSDKISKFNTSDSQWYAFRKISNTRVDVLDKNSLLVNYGFDVEKFFDSDLFNAAIPQFQRTIEKGISDCKEFSEKLDRQDKSVVEKCISSISDSIRFLKNSDFNDKYYKLTSVSSTTSSARSREEIQKSIDAKYDKMHQSNIKRMAGAKTFSDKAAKKDYIYQKLHGEDEVTESSKWDCEVKKETENGEEVWKIYEKDGHIWVATFHDEATANAFAKTYPKMKEDYLKQAREAETKEEMVEKEELSVEEVAEKELDDKIEEAMKEIYK